jgi:hypothetical protein
MTDDSKTIQLRLRRLQEQEPSVLAHLSETPVGPVIATALMATASALAHSTADETLLLSSASPRKSPPAGSMSGWGERAWGQAQPDHRRPDE